MPTRALPRACLLACVLALGACASAPPDPVRAPAVPASFRHAGANAGAEHALPPQGWWALLEDPELDRLQALAAEGSTAIEAAAARLAKARALARGAQAARAPQLALRAGAVRQGGPLLNDAGAEGTLVTALADISWEVDLFGRLRRAAGGASLDAAAREELLRDARLLAQATVAETWLALRAADAEHALLQAAAEAWRETAAITGQRLRAGSVAELEWVRARAELASVESEALAVQRQRATLEHALALATGSSASDFELPVRAQLPPLPAVPAGLPAAMLARRPDIAAAQRNLEAAQLRVGLARDAWLPDLNLAATGGTASPALGKLLQASLRTWSVAALAGMTLLDAGRREAGVQAAQADLAAAAATWREQVLVALREAEDQLAALQLLAAQAQVQAAGVELAQRAAQLAQSRQRSGLASQLEVLDARRGELRARRDALQVRSAQHQATVRLVRALGGGW